MLAYNNAYLSSIAVGIALEIAGGCQGLVFKEQWESLVCSKLSLHTHTHTKCPWQNHWYIPSQSTDTQHTTTEHISGIRWESFDTRPYQEMLTCFHYNYCVVDWFFMYTWNKQHNTIFEHANHGNVVTTLIHSWKKQTPVSSVQNTW